MFSQSTPGAAGRSPLLNVLMLAAHVNPEQDAAVEAEPALEAGQPAR